ncbi:hypothetical protein AX15_002781 [Amanita polypyramis BW_CC]|nr:hypothetical protein AX15_002781 [Amanita polypyramis BW_CC]
MSLNSPAHASPVTVDPFNLDHLAHELELRESVQDDIDRTLDLPAYVPLSHDNPFLSAKTFNVQEFLLSRSYASLPDLRTELRDYLAKLKEELVQLINDEYEAFISLSTDLRDEGDRLQKIKEPLQSFRERVQSSKDGLRVIHDAVQEKLSKRATLRKEKALLQLLLKISESVSRLESLLLIPSPEDDKSELLGINNSKQTATTAAGEAEDGKFSTNRAKYLARVAAEYTQLVYHVSKARDEQCAFVDTVQWRIDRIRSTLSSDLDHVWASTLSAFTGGKATEIEKSKLIADMTDCLRTYDVLELWKDAEEVIRKEVVRGFVKKTVYSDALAAPHSPIIPHTPLPVHRAPSIAAPLPSSIPLRTPYTPFTAFLRPNQLTTHSSSTLPGSPYAHLLQDDEYPLTRLFNQMLRFVQRDLCRIMELAEKVSVKTRRSIGAGPQKDNDQVNEKGFNILANVIWDEFAHAVVDELGRVVFSVGRPDEFRKHYELTHAFIRSLEYLAPSGDAVHAMRSHPTYEKVQRRWQLPVYFQLRWKEIIGKLEESLSLTPFDTSSANITPPFATAQCTAVWIAISACWSEEIYIPDLCHKFWRLTLQILSRYNSWIDTVIRLSEHIPAADKVLTSPMPASRSGTPLPSGEMPSTEVIAAEEVTVRQYATVIVDIRALELATLALWREEISMMVPEVDGSDAGVIGLENALRHTLSNLTRLIEPMSNQIVNILTKRCCEALLPVRSVPAQFRAMANKRMPHEPSYFVLSILRPVKAFFGIGTSEGVGSPLRNKFLTAYATEVFDSVTQKYILHLTTMKKTEESLKRLKKGKKSTFSMFGGASVTKDEEGRDEERIRAQMVIDVEAFGQDALILGVDTEKHDPYKALKELVHTAEGVHNTETHLFV